MRLTRICAALATGVAAAAAGVGAAGPAGAAGSLSLLTHCTGHFGSFGGGGFSNESFSTPAVGDLAGNGTMDAVVGELDGTVQWWSLTSCAHGSFTVGGRIEASPVLVDLNHDGHLDVLVASMTGLVEAFTPSLGNRVIFRVATRYQNFATPAVGDLLGNGQLDVVEPSTDQHLYAWNSAGRLLSGFPFFFGDSGFSSPTITDLYGNGKKEIVFGFDCAGVQGQFCYPQHGGYLAAVGSNGRLIWKTFFAGQPVWSTPAVADVDGDGKPDIVVGTGNMPCNPAAGQTSMCGGKAVYAVNYLGQRLPGWPVVTSGRTTSSPAVGDVLGTGKLEVAITDDVGYLYLIRGTGSSGRVNPVIWKKCIYQSCPASPGGGPHSSATIADLFHNGRLEVLSSGEGTTGLYVFDGPTGNRITVPADKAFHSVTGAPTVSQVNGHAMILIETIYPGGHGTYLGRWQSSTALGYSPWPTFKRDTLREATLVDQAPLAGVAGGAYVLDPATQNIGLETGGGLSLTNLNVTSGLDAVPVSGSTYLVFGRDLKGHVGYCTLTGTSCAGWHTVSTWTVTAAPTAARLGNGMIEIAIRGLNGYGYLGALNGSTGTVSSGWTQMGGPILGRFSVASYGSGPATLLAYTSSSTGAEMVRSRNTLGAWSATWANLGAKSMVGPGLVATTAGRVDVLQLGTNHHVYEKSCTVSSCGSTWADWGGYPFSSPDGYYASGTVHLYAVNFDGRIYSREVGVQNTGWLPMP